MQDKKLKIGVVTYWTSKDNYGQLLQAYALQKVLRDAGHDAFLIRYDHRTNTTMQRNWRRLIKVCNPLSVVRYVQRRKEKSIKQPELSRNFDRFLEEHIVVSEIYSAQRLNADPPAADVYICGSDQIWKVTYIGVDQNFYLRFAPAGHRKIAYAASFGGCTASDRAVKQISKLVQDFDLITVREKAGLEICRRAGRQDALCVPDPTMLLPVSAYQQLAIMSDGGKKYLLLYLLGSETALDIASVYEFARAKDLVVVYVPSQGRTDNYPKTHPTIEQWLGLIAGAKYVVTNSFHGAVFSILFNTQFAVALLAGNANLKATNERIDTLLTMTGLESRVLGDDIQAIELPIDYAPVNAVLQTQREWATGLLLQNINNIR